LGNDRVLYAQALKNSRDTSHAGFADALETARAADAVVLFLGEEQILSGEAHSRAFLDLPGAQEALVDEVAQAGKPMIAIIMGGRPLTFHTPGPAIADVLFGDAVPSGKLTMTFPRTVGQVPIYYAHLNTGRPASPSELGIPLGNPLNPQGYTSKYVDVDFTPEYPFGYGLSYTTFQYSNVHVSQPVLRSGEQLRVEATVTNTGTREADEIVQLYTHQETASISRPVRELKGFQRIRLKPAEKLVVKFMLSYRDLAFYDESLRLITEPGKFHVWIAPDSASGVEAMFTAE
jgi:beta-glucosidase